MFQLKHFLADRGIPEYNPLEVHKYLNQIVSLQNQESLCYSWFCLRKTDKKRLDKNKKRFGTFNWFHDGKHAHWRIPEIYDELVPSSVLETVSTIVEEFPDALFFVSKIQHVKDPFLAVTFSGETLVVIDFWSEPGFRPISYEKTPIEKLINGTEVKEWAESQKHSE